MKGNPLNRNRTLNPNSRLDCGGSTPLSIRFFRTDGFSVSIGRANRPGEPLPLRAGDLRPLGTAERNSPKAKVRPGPSERVRASHWVRGEVLRVLAVSVVNPIRTRKACP